MLQRRLQVECATFMLAGVNYDTLLPGVMEDNGRAVHVGKAFVDRFVSQ